MSRPYAMVLVTWVDAECRPGWGDHDEIVKWAAADAEGICYSAGILLRADDALVVVVPNWNDDEYGDATRIPAGNVISIQTLRLAK